jgi:5,10-methylenetetrahydromethanopterin reductase
VTGRTKPRRGIWVFPSAPGAEILEAAVAADAAGLDEFWIGDEGAARDPFAVLAAAAARTSRIALGIAVTNPYLRHPAVTAAAMMTVDELSHGRAILGLGPGGRVALGPVGVRRERPLATTRAALRTMRAVTHGESAHGYEPPSHAFTRPGLPIYIGSRSAAFQRLASAEADGVFLGGVPLPATATVIGWTQETRPIDVLLYTTAAFDDATRESSRRRMILPLADSPDEYLDSIDLSRAAVEHAAERFRAGDASAAARLIDDEVLANIIIAGDATEVGHQLLVRAERFQPHGIGLSFTGSDLLAYVEATADAVKAFDAEWDVAHPGVHP